MSPFPDHQPEGCLSGAVARGVTVQLPRIYKNEAEVGLGIAQAIREGLAERSSLFIVGKLWNTFHKPEDVER